MFRIPSLAEILGLFFGPSSVAAAAKVLTDTAKRLDDVAAHHTALADAKNVKAGSLRAEASKLVDEVASHQAEIGRAASIAAKLGALLS